MLSHRSIWLAIDFQGGLPVSVHGDLRGLHTCSTMKMSIWFLPTATPIHLDLLGWKASNWTRLWAIWKAEDLLCLGVVRSGFASNMQTAAASSMNLSTNKPSGWADLPPTTGMPFLCVSQKVIDSPPFATLHSLKVDKLILAILVRFLTDERLNYKGLQWFT